MSESTFRYANTVNGICERVTTNLNDDEHGRENVQWTREYIKALVQDTLKLFACLNPSLFADEVEFEVGATNKGVYTVDEAVCETLVDITAVIDDSGRSVPVQDSDYSMLSKVAMYPAKSACCRGKQMGTTAMFTYARNPDNPTQFRLTPKVLPGATVKVCATCTNVQQFLDDEDKEIRCEFVKMIPAVQQWVMYVALLTKEPGSEAAAETHRAAFFDLVPWTISAIQNAQSRLAQ